MFDREGGDEGRRIERAARFIADLRLRRNGIAPPVDDLPADCRPEDVATGYAIQASARLLIAAGGFGEPVGWKVGATTPAMQERLGIFSPCAGTIYRGTVHHGTATLARSDYRRLMLECEIGVRLASDLPGRPGGHTIVSVAPAVAAVMTSIEIVEHRFVDPRRVSTATHVADDFFSVGAVLGEEHPPEALADPAAMPGRITVNGKVAYTGRASDILGHPLNSLAWLADHCAAVGTPLAAGALITLGSISPGAAIEEPGEVEVRFEGLTPVRCRII